MKVRVHFAWYQWTVGFYFDRWGKTLYIYPFPMILIHIIP